MSPPSFVRVTFVCCSKMSNFNFESECFFYGEIQGSERRRRKKKKKKRRTKEGERDATFLVTLTQGKRPNGAASTKYKGKP